MSSQTSEKVLWFTAGAAVGASLALLFAPMAGDQLRRQLGESVDEGSASLLDTGREWFEKGRELYEQGRQIANEAAEMFEEGKKLSQSPQ